MHSFAPVIIIGAARSGTNMLRDTLTKSPELGTWPCDEINYIWRYGNTHFPSDELCIDQATPVVREYVRNAFFKLQEKRNINIVVEKTTANSLRVGFVNHIFPEARFIFIVRNGWDVVASAMKRWTAPLDLSYVFAKARYIPISDVPFYGLRYLSNRIHKLLQKEKRLAYWGPCFEGMAEMLQTHSLTEVCAMQWTRSVDCAREQLDQIENGRVCFLRYEDFVRAPQSELVRIRDFLGLRIDEECLRKQVGDVSSRRIGKGKEDLSDEQRKSAHKIMAATLSYFGYH